MLSSIAIGIPQLAGKYDAVVATSPQFFVAIAGWLIAAFLGKPFVFEVRDLWPASIVAVGAIRNKHVIRLLERVEMFLYRRARLIVAVADSTVDILARRGVDRSKIAVVKNGVDLAKFAPAARDGAVREEYRLGGKFVCSYIGTIGMAHGLEIALDAAEKTKGDEGLSYVIVGEGARRTELEAEAKRRRLTNVIFTGEVPRDRVPEFLAASDAVLVHLKKAELFEHVIPSKIFEIMGSARPIIMGVGGEAGALVREAGAGILIEPENVGEFLAAIETLRKDRRRAEAMGRAGRAFVEANFDRQVLAEKYLELLDRLAR
jgi:glycosyltransferase involved in cell wall biosynthesis